MSRRKIIFVIVEGPSDEETVGVLLNRIYSNNSVYVHVMYCDITAELEVNPRNIVAKIGNLVKDYAGRIFKPEDFRNIIHIADMDGAYIPNDAIVDDVSALKPVYSTTMIRTANKKGIENRNQRKRENLNRLSSINKIWNIPYQIYYMSCNLDHVLYGKLNCSDDEKEFNALNFAKKYMDNIPCFIKYMSNSDFSVIDNYSKSWDFIREDLHSLERHTNLGLCLKIEY